MAKHHHRIAARQAANAVRKNLLLDRMPRAFRPRLRVDQLRDLGLAHIQNLDAIATGQADPPMIWDYTSSVLCWWKAAQLMATGVPEMDEQLEVATRLVERYSRTGRVLFDGPDLVIARRGVTVMDLLAELVDQATAIAAADWSEREINRMHIAAEQLRAQEASPLSAETAQPEVKR